MVNISKMSSRILNKKYLLFAVAGLACLTVTASEIDQKTDKTVNPLPFKNFELNYKADFNGMQIKAVHRLTQLTKGQFKEYFEAKGLLGKVTETEFFDITSDEQIIPKENTYRRSLIGTKRTEKQQYDWSKNIVTYIKGNKTDQIPLKSGYLDSMSHKQQLRRDMVAGKDVLTYAVISRGKLKQYTYQVISDEVLSTPVGPLDTRLIKRTSDDGTKTTKVWLAKDWDFIMIRLERSDKGDTQKMYFTGGQLGNETIRPTEIDVEK